MTGEIVYAFAMALVAALVSTLAAIFWMRRSLAPAAGFEIQRLQTLEAELVRLRDAKENAERRLAAEETKAARVPELEHKLEEQMRKLENLREAKETIELQLASVNEIISQERKQTEEKLALLTEARENMVKEFKILADEIMSRHGAAFSQQNKEQVEGLVAPLRERLAEFQKNLRDTHTETAKDCSALREQIRQLSEQSSQMSAETHKLTQALKGKAPVQGAWGEMVLYTILEKSGLREGEEYVKQASVTAEDGTKLRPDAIVNLPGEQKVAIVIDSKVSLTAFNAYVNAETEEERKLALANHLSSVKKHICELGAKSYSNAARSVLDYVIMFVPIEGALAAAIEAEKGLTAFALDNNVAIATPTTLMVVLRTVANLWRVERQNRNAEEIADRAGKLYDKFVNFLGDMQHLGTRLDDARKYYDLAMNKLKTGNGNVVRQIEQLKEMGAKASKAIPPALIEGAVMEALPAPELAAE